MDSYLYVVDGTNLPIDPRGVLLISPDSASPNSLKMTPVTVVSVDDHVRYREAYRRVFNIVLGGILTYFAVSAEALHAKVAEANQAFAERRFQPQTHPEEAVRLVSEIRSAVLSLASAVYFHQDQTYQLASDLHANDETVLASIEKVFKDVFDTNRGYRLLHSLRNVMTHYTMEAVTVSGRALQVADGRMEARFNLRIDRGVAARSKKINKVVKAEFERMQDDPDVLELLDELHSPLYRADQRISALLYPDMRQTCETIVEFDNLFKGAPGIRALVSDWNPGVRGQRPSWTAWAPQLFEFAHRQLAP
jgi:hypothetical protein